MTISTKPGYVVRHYFTPSIKRVEVSRTTGASYWEIRYGKERRNKRSTTYEEFFETFAEAKAFLKGKMEQKIVKAQRLLDEAKNNLAYVEGLEEPHDD